jgi:large subunit ribosomal protein L18
MSMNKEQQKIVKRVRRHARVRSVVTGTSLRPRLAVFRANQHIYAQLIDDEAGKTIAASSTADLVKVGEANAKGTKVAGTKTEQSAAVGTLIAEKAKAAGITTVVFDRGGFQYHGRVKALADAARAAGLIF